MNMDSYQIPDGPLVRPYGSYILVERIELGETYKNSSIIVAREKEDATAIGIVRAVGKMYSKKNGRPLPIDLEPGLKVAFLWFYAERHTNQKIQQVIGKNFIFLKWEDISLAWDPKICDYEITDIKSMGT